MPNRAMWSVYIYLNGSTFMKITQKVTKRSKFFVLGADHFFNTNFFWIKVPEPVKTG